MHLHVAALSGGADSSAMCLKMRELGMPTTYVCTPTGNELPEMLDHWTRLEDLLEAPILRIEHPRGGLLDLARAQAVLPSTLMRWCTRMLKIETYRAWVLAQRAAGARLVTSYVGLRADEEEREGMYGPEIDEYRYPLRDLGWSRADVETYLERLGVVVPPRTDCALCPYQQLHEWYALLKNHPELYWVGALLEQYVSDRRGQLYTIRSPSRDTWPAGLVDLARAFDERGPPRKRRRPSNNRECRVCRM